MKYHDGKDVKLGDAVSLGGQERAIVVCIIDEGAALPGYNIDDWKYLEKGVLFNSESAGNTYFTVPDEDTKLISRSTG
jgi:hypothetical protein